MINFKLAIFFLAFAFPYVSFGLGGTSPILLLVMVFYSSYIIFSGPRRPTYLGFIWVAFVIFISTYYFLFDVISTGNRVLWYGLCVPSAFVIYRTGFSLKNPIYVLSVIRIWYFILALSQLIIGLDNYSSLFGWMISVRYADGRGLPVAGPEPTTFAFLYLLFAIAAYSLTRSENSVAAKRLLCLDVILAFIYTLSSSIVLIGVLFYFLRALVRQQYLMVIKASFLAIPVFSALIYLAPDLRISYLIKSLFDLAATGADILMFFDESVIDRLSALPVALYFSAQNFLMPMDPKVVVSGTIEISEAFSYMADERYQRIHLNTGLGELIIFFGIASFYPLARLFKVKEYSPDIFLILLIIYSFGIPFGHPGFWIVVAIIVANNKQVVRRVVVERVVIWQGNRSMSTNE